MAETIETTKPEAKKRTKKRTKKAATAKHRSNGVPVRYSGEMIELDPAEIKAGWRARKDYGNIDDLADSIRRVGQMHPILVKKTTKGYFIVSGMRRTRACKKLGVKVKAIVVKPGDELNYLSLQLEENVHRKGFDRLEVGEGLRRYKEVYEKAHPETKKGATLKKGTKEAKAKTEEDADRFTIGAAKALGVSERLVYKLLKIGNMPKPKKDKINAAKTTAERNKLTNEAVREMNYEEKQRKLEDRSKAAKVRSSGLEGALLHCDCREVMPETEHGKVDLILTDPPYGEDRSLVSHVGRTDIGTEIEWDELDVGWVIDAAPLLRASGQMLIFSPLERIAEYKAVIESVGLTYHMPILWHKTNPGTVHRSTYLHAVEAIIWATKGGKYTFREWKNQTGDKTHNVITGPICGGNERLAHPTQKPLWLIKQLMRQHAVRGEVVLDPFCGSGTTLVAAKDLGMTGIGMESELKYIKMARARLNATKKPDAAKKQGKADKADE